MKKLQYMTLEKIQESPSLASIIMTSDFTANDYIELIQEIQYHEYCIGLLDGDNLSHAKEIVIRFERIEYLNDLLNQYRAMQARKGFKLIKGGKA